MKLNDVRRVVALAERGGLPEAAADLGVSQHALLRSVRALEREFGAALFRRSRRVMTPTPVGAVFVRRASAAQAELDRARDDVARGADAATPGVSIGLSAGSHIPLLPSVLGSLQIAFPDVQVRITESAPETAEREVRDGGLDLYVGPVGSPHAAGGLRVDRLADGRQIVAARAGHPLAGATSLAELAGARWVASSRRELDLLFGPLRPSPPLAVQAETALSRVSAAVSSDVLLILPASWRPLIERTALLIVLPLVEPLETPTYLATRNGPLPAPVAHLRSAIVAAS